jgi:predicted nucleotidyltransferase
MPDLYQQLLGRAQRVASIYAAHPQARAVIVVGSLARRQYDAYSDIDMTVFYENMPTEDEIRAGRGRNSEHHISCRCSNRRETPPSS